MLIIVVYHGIEIKINDAGDSRYNKTWLPSGVYLSNDAVRQ